MQRCTIPNKLAGAFRVCGYVGILLACALATGLVARSGLAFSVLGGIIPTAVTSFLAVAMATKVIGGEERLVYYHQQIAILCAAALFLRVLHQPILSYLDITVVGLGVFLACGRIGCLLVGCCHGRPFRWGICYTEKHAAAGFTPYYVGVSLFPVQALESLCVLTIVGMGTSMILRGSAPGSALTWYIIAYGFGRFCFEFLRGDPDRPYFLGFSEAQCTSLILMSLAAVGETTGVLPFRRWHIESVAFMAMIMVAVTVHRRIRAVPSHRLTHPKHVREIAEALQLFVPSRAADSQPRPWIRVARTSLGIHISGGEVQLQSASVHYYALSWSGQPLNQDVARALGIIISRLNHGGDSFHLLNGRHGVFTVLFDPVG